MTLNEFPSIRLGLKHDGTPEDVAVATALAKQIVRAVNAHADLLVAVKLLLDAVHIPDLTKADIKFILDTIDKAETRNSVTPGDGK